MATKISETETQEGSKTYGFALYPRHFAVVQDFAKRDGRNLSNAMQRIIEQWAEQNDKEREAA